MPGGPVTVRNPYALPLILLRVNSLDQSQRQSQRFSQARFLALHLPIVMFVIVSGEVEHSMQSKNSNLVSDRMSQSTRIPGGNFCRDRDIASKSWQEAGPRWKR